MAVYRVKNIFDEITRREPLTVRVPGSKSITNRALLIATLAEGESLLRGALFSDDSRYFLRCIKDLGFEAQEDERSGEIRVKGLGGPVPRREASVYVGSAGTAARFLTAYLGLTEGVWRLDASEQMRRRPMQPLLDSLRQLGTQVRCEQREGFFPYTLIGGYHDTRQIRVDIEKSSQFLSALLISACTTGKPMDIRVEGSHGMAYIDMTVRLMEDFGVQVERPEADRFLIPAGRKYRAGEYRIEPDVSAACYFYALAPLLGIGITVEQVHFNSMQGDIEFLHILERMGCTLYEGTDGITLKGPADGRYHGVTADMRACSDQAITLAALAPFADGPTRITGIGHIRYQESDRMRAIAQELRKLGIRCEEKEDSLTIWPGAPSPGLVATYDDHRMAMGFSLIGLRAGGIEIDDPACCRKTFENYFEVLDDAVEQLSRRS